MEVAYSAISKSFKHVSYHPGRYLHIVDVTCRTIDFDYSEKERVDQIVIGSDESMDMSDLKIAAREKLVEEHPDFQFYREIEVVDLHVVEAFDRELT
ncbi:hypothetical protein [Paenibacillus marinisediminis]